MRISDWSSDVCSSDLLDQGVQVGEEVEALDVRRLRRGHRRADRTDVVAQVRGAGGGDAGEDAGLARGHGGAGACVAAILARRRTRAARAAGGPQPRWPRRHVFTSPRARSAEERRGGKEWFVTVESRG